MESITQIARGETGMVLIIYNDQICKEILMPNMYNTDYQIRLDASDYGLKKDIVLKLERGENEWKIVGTSEYWITMREGAANSKAIAKDDLIRIDTRSGDHLIILAADVPIALQSMEKYDLQGIDKVTIGRSDDNTIVYSFQALISGVHAVLQRRGSEWVLLDNSRNGIYCRNLRVKGSHVLQFGETVEFFGLHLMVNGQVLMVGANCGTLRVSEKLPELAIDPYTPQPHESISEKKNAYFNRAPRKLPVLYREKIQIDEPPAPAVKEKKSANMVIGPAFVMAIPMLLGIVVSIYASQAAGRSAGFFMFTGIVTALGSAVLGGIWVFFNMQHEKKRKEEGELERITAYNSYLSEITEKIKEMYLHNTRALCTMYPSVRESLRFASGSPELWNRNTTHEDFLYQRLGVGDADFQVSIEIPRKKFTLVSDPLADKPKEILNEYKTLRQVPIGINFRENQLIGLIGGSGRSGCYDMMHVLTASIAASHSYTDVKLIYIYNEENRRHLQDWECMRWLPHVWSQDKSIRFMAGNEIEIRDVFFHLGNVLRSREENENSAGEGQNTVPKPYYILFIEDPALLEGEMLTKYIYHPRAEYGMTTFLMAEYLPQLPNTCEMVIENDGGRHLLYSLKEAGSSRTTSFVPDEITSLEMEAFGKALSGIIVEEIEEGMEIPGSVSFMEMYGADSLEDLDVPERWRKNRTYNSMKVPVGIKAGGSLCYLDIHEKFHGPHGLVAGTTGSGKSETLQTYMLSLAVNYSPEDVSFFIIDFKGGGMANLFEGIPHLAGMISNLSGNQVRRAMISIKSENIRRQKIFAENGVNNINSYTRLYKNHEAAAAVPHLFIIIDEFAELKREEPAFMQELISVAQVGRSLGVHLILATQKPAGTVDDNIRANSRFKLCLRVQDKQDSMDMLQNPDASLLTQAGRCYLQVGNNEVYELFQSGYSGAPYREGGARTSSAVSLISRSGKADLVGNRKGDGGKSNREPEGKRGHEESQLNAIISYLRALAEKEGYQKSSQLWLPVLKDTVYLEEIGGVSSLFKRSYIPSQIGRKWFLETAIGIYDDPEEQAQRPLTIRYPDCGHIAVCGSAVSGKSTFLQTMICGLLSGYSPEELQMYLLDFSSQMLVPFEPAPHVGGVVTSDQEDMTDKFFHMLEELYSERRSAMQGGNYIQYVQVYGVKMPAVVVIIDNFAMFRVKCGDKYDDLLLRLMREGVSCGVFFILTSQGFGLNEIPMRLGDQIRTVFALEQQDKFKYMDVLRRSRIELLPEEGIKGRGLAVVGEKVLEFQTALSFRAEDDFTRGQAIRKFSEEIADSWTGSKARKIPCIPEKPTLELLTQEEGYEKAILEAAFLPVGYRQKDAALVGIPLGTSFCSVVTGRARSGKTNTLKILIEAAGRMKAEMILVEKTNGGISGYRHELSKWNIRHVTDDRGLYDYFTDLIPVFRNRNTKKWELLDRGFEEDQIVSEMAKEKPIFIFIDNLMDLINMVYKPALGVGAMSGFFENITEKGKLHNIYLIAGLRVEDELLLTGYKGFKLFITDKSGIHLGGNLAGQKLFNFQNIPYSEASKSLKKGMAHISVGEDEGETIVIPCWR